DEVRQAMKKDMRREDIFRVARIVKQAGLKLQAYFIVGYPGETTEQRGETYRMIDDLDLDLFTLHKFMAIPGTATFLKLVKNGPIERDHIDVGHISDGSLPDFSGDGRRIDRELFLTYLGFYLRRPWKVPTLFEMVSTGSLVRSFDGLMRRALATIG